MPNLTQLRLDAREIFGEALGAVDAGAAVRKAVRLEGSRLIICDNVFALGARKFYSIAIGKAASPMAGALDEVLGDKLAGGIITSHDPAYRPGRGSDRLSDGTWRLFDGGHPEPNEDSFAAARACFELLECANQERALVIFLISGGGSAMIEWPIVDDITLEDLRGANRVLVNCGASIGEINSVRRAFSAVKGGRLAERAPRCDQITLIVSDVPSGEEENVASGPTVWPRGTLSGAHAIIARYHLRSHLPEAVLRAIDAEMNIPGSLGGASVALRRHFVLLNNGSALEAAAKAARRRGRITEIAHDISDQSIEAGCVQLLSRLRGLHKKAARQESTACLISGGEFACPVKGAGLGGRNLETALRLAIEYYDQHLTVSGTANELPAFVAFCAGTDGIDGNSPAAGAIVDHTTTSRARAIGLDPEDFLNRSDAYSFFVALGDAIATGPTGTNVRDIRILLTTARTRGE